MALEVYFPQDIRNVLLAAEQASSAALMATQAEHNEFAQGYREGYRAALTTLALAFGLIRPDDRRESHNWQPAYLPTAPQHGGRNGQS
jgi:hypothetical protein